MPPSPSGSLLHDVLTSRVYDVARETPLDPAPRLSRRLAAEVLLKREDLQPVFSFKLRGAYNRIANMTDAERARGVIAASAGNHAQGVAYSARHLGLRAVIVMPKTTPEIKVEAVRAMGSEVVLEGDSYSEAKASSSRGRARSARRSCASATGGWTSSSCPWAGEGSSPASRGTSRRSCRA
jgi:threonine dehydratase